MEWVALILGVAGLLVDSLRRTRKIGHGVLDGKVVIFARQAMKTSIALRNARLIPMGKENETLWTAWENFFADAMDAVGIEATPYRRTLARHSAKLALIEWLAEQGQSVHTTPFEKKDDDAAL